MASHHILDVTKDVKIAWLPNICLSTVAQDGGVSFEGGDEGGVIIPETNFALTDEHMLQLQQQVNPLAESRNHGIALYETTVHFITQIIEQNQSLYLQ